LLVLSIDKSHSSGGIEVSFVQKEPLVGEMELIGARLKQARVGANLALQDISDRTRISLRFLVAIENDDFSALPGRVYIFGFTKAFAREVGIDEESLLSAIREKMQLAGID
jgi:cytoskeletal protein RodZ